MPRPDRAVTSEKVPFRLLRYSAWSDAVAGRPGQFRELINSASCHPAPSASKNAAPDPIVSGRYFRPNAPLLWRKRMPAVDVTSVNAGTAASGFEGALWRAAVSDTMHSADAAPRSAMRRISVPPGRWIRARAAIAARCCREDAADG